MMNVKVIGKEYRLPCYVCSQGSGISSFRPNNQEPEIGICYVLPLLMLRTIGILLPIFVMARAFAVVQRRRHLQVLSVFIIKNLYFGRHSTDREVAIMILMAYLSYMLSELLDLSAILTVFFCGIVMSHYTWHNVTERSRVNRTREMV